MNANTPRQSPAEHDESAKQLLSRTAHDLPAGRHQFHKERLMAQIHQSQQEERTAAAEAVAPARTRRLRPAITLPVLAAALAGTVVAGVALNDNSGVKDAGVATGPALTTHIGAATTKGVPQLLDQISLAAAESEEPTRPSSPASTSTSSPRRPTRS